MSTKYTVILSVVTFGVGFFLGYKLMQNRHIELVIEKEYEYQVSIEKAREQERIWQIKAQELENEYQNQIDLIKQSNDDVINRLRNQLDRYAERLSSCTKSSDGSDGTTGTTSVSKEVKRLVNFSEQCARRADELIIQVNGLQQWYKEISQ